MVTNLNEPSPKDVGEFVRAVSQMSADLFGSNMDSRAMVGYAVMFYTVACALRLPHDELHDVIDYVCHNYEVEIVDDGGTARDDVKRLAN